MPLEVKSATMNPLSQGVVQHALARGYLTSTPFQKAT